MIELDIIELDAQSQEFISRRTWVDRLPGSEETKLLSNGNPMARPRAYVGRDDPYDPATQVKEGPTIDIQPTQVVYTYTIRALTAQEITDAEEANKDTVLLELESKILVEILKGLFDHENRIRVLEGSPTITAAQFKTAVRNRIGSTW